SGARPSVPPRPPVLQPHLVEPRVGEKARRGRGAVGVGGGGRRLGTTTRSSMRRARGRRREEGRRGGPRRPSVSTREPSGLPAGRHRLALGDAGGALQA